MRTRIALALIVVVGMFAVTSSAYASAGWTISLTGFGWNQPEVLVYISPAAGVKPQTINDVQAAIDDLNTAMHKQLEKAPTLKLTTDQAMADITVYLIVTEGEHLGTATLRSEVLNSCVLKRVSVMVYGRVFGRSLSDTGIRIVAKHELLHALGVGHSNRPGDLMYPTVDEGTVLGIDDTDVLSCHVAAIRAIYPLAPYCILPQRVDCF